MYQTTDRRTATKAKLHVITQYLNPEAKTAIDIGSQQGIITVRLADLGLSVIGYEGNSSTFRFSQQFAMANFNKAHFVNKYFDVDVLSTMKDIDVVLMLSVHHQIARKYCIKYANQLIVELFKKVKYQLFLEPCMIYEKYGTRLPFIENDYQSIMDYFKNVLTASKCKFNVCQVGIFTNRLPEKEPFRPLLLFSKTDLPEIKSSCGSDICTIDKYQNSFKTQLVKVSLDDCVHYLQSPSSQGWHYFAATASYLLVKHSKNVPEVTYEKNPLYAYYKAVMPSTYGEMWRMSGNKSDIGPMEKMPMGHYCNWTPWSSKLSDTMENIYKGITVSPHHPPHDSHAYGPTPDAVGIFELQRIWKLLTAFMREGYQPELYNDGYIRGVVIKWGDNVRFMVTAGGHRIGVLKALGYNWFTAKLQPGSRIISKDDAAEWPQVKNNVYTLQQALNLLEGLFNVDGKPIERLVQKYLGLNWNDS